MSKAFKWPKLPNSRLYLDKGYTSIQMREYAMKCIGEAIRNKEWINLSTEEVKKIYEKFDGSEFPFDFFIGIQNKLREKNCGQ